MKLNKVLALALSGVMAVSMLAGCSGNSGNGGQEGEQPPVADNTIASVLNDEQKDNEVKVNFTYSSSLEAALQKTLGVVGNDADPDKVDVDGYLANVLGVDEDVTLSEFCGRKSNTHGGNEVGEQTAVIVYKDSNGKTAEGAVKDMYKSVLNKSNDMSELDDEWTSNNVKWSFSYTGEVASVSVIEGTQTSTYVAVVITCNTTKALAD